MKAIDTQQESQREAIAGDALGESACGATALTAPPRDYGGWAAVRQGYHALCSMLRPWHLAVLAALALAALLLPMLILARYNYSMVDDFFFAQAGRDAWRESHSLWAVLAAAARYTHTRYLSWQGLYFGVFVCALQPNIFGEQFQSLGPVIALCVLCAGLLFFSWAALRRALGFSRGTAALAGLSACVVLTQFPPSQNEAFYWYTGAVFYTLIFAAFLFQAGIMLCLHNAKTRRGRAAALVCAVLGAAAMGGSGFMSGLQCLMMQALFVALPLLQKSSRWKFALPPFLVLAAGFAVALAAPGNASRIATEGGTQGFIPTIWASLAAVPFWLGRALRFPAWLFLLPLAPVFWGAAGPCKFRFRLPGLVAAGAYLFLAAGLCPGLYALGDNLPYRYENWMFFTSVAALYGCFIYALGWLRQKLHALHTAGRLKKDAGSAVAAFCRANSLGLALVLALALAGGFAALGARDTLLRFGGAQALDTIRSGSALAYRQEMDYRVGVLSTAAPGSDAVVPLLEAKPPMLFRHEGDLHENPGGWLNGVESRYYGLQSITAMNLWDFVTLQITEARPGDILRFPASYRAAIPPQVFSALRGRDVTLILQRPGEVYAFHGQSLASIKEDTWYGFTGPADYMDLAALGFQIETTDIGWF